MTTHPAPHPAADTSVPHPARIRSYWLGGKDNSPAGDAYTAVFPRPAPGGAALRRRCGTPKVRMSRACSSWKSSAAGSSRGPRQVPMACRSPARVIPWPSAARPCPDGCAAAGTRAG
ncbi:SAM-dependent methyltransferase [Streptomyces achromogenes]|uniref:SAM-dependent methyltransferase n=1 Tax=Streptomyces achromogenes TaxID=67255 RepID=UPI0036783B68